MGKVLVLAEKPSVGRDIARVLNCKKQGNGFFEGERYIVTWALGHLVTLAEPENYDDKYKTWQLEDLPMLPNSLKLVVIKKSGKQFSTVKAQMSRKDVSEIVIATDAGREGELVARWIIEKARVQKPLKRLWISSVTDKAILDGFKKLKPGNQYENLYRSAVARAEADWYVGINATRALTCKYNAQLSCGRVQTPTLAIIAHREQEIKNFKPRSYFGITAQTDLFQLTWRNEKTKEHRIFNKEKCDTILRSVQNKQAQIVDVHTSAKKSFAPSLYDLTELQRDANRIFGFSAKETLAAMQKLYEQHKVLTYPRTDSKYLTTDIVSTLKDRVDACAVHPYKTFTSKILAKKMKINNSVINNDKVSDHHAIIPTEQSPMIQTFSDKERKIYDLVVKRFLANFMSPFTYEQMTITVQIENEQFVANGKRIIDQGWKEVYGDHFKEESDDSIPDQSLPKVEKGDRLQVLSVKQTNGQTKPPSRFTEGTLLAAMENPTKFLTSDNKAIVQTLGKTGGLGTVATRADIIEKLFNGFFIEKKGKELLLTGKGKQVLDLVPEELKSPELTGEWELKLEAIAQGKLEKNKFVHEIKDYSKKAVSEIKMSEQKFKHDNVTGTKCPDCGKLMLEVKGKKGKMLVCQDRECGNRKNISKVTNARCPKCKKKLELRGQGEGQMFICKCGHREKLTTFNERRQNEKKKQVSKRDVSNYMKKQKKEEPINTALADALAKLNLKK